MQVQAWGPKKGSTAYLCTFNQTPESILKLLSTKEQKEDWELKWSVEVKTQTEGFILYHEWQKYEPYKPFPDAEGILEYKTAIQKLGFENNPIYKKILEDAEEDPHFFKYH